MRDEKHTCRDLDAGADCHREKGQMRLSRGLQHRIGDGKQADEERRRRQNGKKGRCDGCGLRAVEQCQDRMCEYGHAECAGETDEDRKL